MISHSKSSYEGNAVFNACLFVRDVPPKWKFWKKRKFVQIWHGDVDLDKDRDVIEKLATFLDKNIFLFRENDGRKIVNGYNIDESNAVAMYCR